MRRYSYVNRIILLLVLAWQSSVLDGQQPETLVPGVVYYDYVKHLVSMPEDLSQVDLSDFEFRCVEKQELISSDVPNVDWVLSGGQDGYLLILANDVLLWKGIDGRDPFLNVPGKYIQFREGIPLHSYSEPQKVNRRGDFNFLIQYKMAELPVAMQDILSAAGYERIRVKTKLTYESRHLRSLNEYNEVKQTLLYEAEEVSVKTPDGWKGVSLDQFPEILPYFRPKESTMRMLVSDELPMGSVMLYDGSHPQLRFRTVSPVSDLPVCDHTAPQIYVYPNPSFGMLTVSMDVKEEGPFSFEVYNVIGHLMHSEVMEADVRAGVKVDLSHLDKGVYLYALKNQKGVYLKSERLVVVER